MQLCARLSPKWQPLLLATAALVLGSASSCGAGFDPASDVQSLRILAVTADQPYPTAGNTLTLNLTFSDSVAQGPRPVQVTWIAGCVNPQRGSYLACYPQLIAQFGALASGQPLADGSLKQQQLAPSESGVIGAATFQYNVPQNVLASGKRNAAGVRVSTVVTFFAVCAGELKPLSGAGASNNALPLGCFDVEGNRLGNDDFVFGYTQQFVFADERPNNNPPLGALTLAGESLTDAAADNTVMRCTEVADEGCARPAASGCTRFDVKVLVADVAEIDPDARDEQGNVLREVLWVDYYAEGGNFDGARQLISDPIRGYTADFSSAWTPPAEAGEVRLWAVVHDNRGGISVASGLVQVQ